MAKMANLSMPLTSRYNVLPCSTQSYNILGGLSEDALILKSSSHLKE
jgi:hypothetical protein